MENRRSGLHRKFEVSRTDGSDRPGGKHEGCKYFVLDLTHDKHAEAAMKAYADSCEAEYPELARDIRNKDWWKTKIPTKHRGWLRRILTSRKILAAWNQRRS